MNVQREGCTTYKSKQFDSTALHWIEHIALIIANNQV